MIAFRLTARKSYGKQEKEKREQNKFYSLTIKRCFSHFRFLSCSNFTASLLTIENDRIFNVLYPCASSSQCRYRSPSHPHWRPTRSSKVSPAAGSSSTRKSSAIFPSCSTSARSRKCSTASR